MQRPISQKQFAQHYNTHTTLQMGTVSHFTIDCSLQIADKFRKPFTVFFWYVTFLKICRRLTAPIHVANCSLYVLSPRQEHQNSKSSCSCQTIMTRKSSAALFPEYNVSFHIKFKNDFKPWLQQKWQKIIFKHVSVYLSQSTKACGRKQMILMAQVIQSSQYFAWKSS